MIKLLFAIILTSSFLSGCATFNPRTELNELRERIVIIEESQKRTAIELKVHEYFIKQLLKENSILKQKLKNYPM